MTMGESVGSPIVGRAAMFTSAIIKLTAICNLNCTYCYMFNLHDKTYTRVPAFMPEQTARSVVDRIETYMRSNDIPSFTLVLHGGEPTLWPVESFRSFLDHLSSARSRGVDIRPVIQSNGYSIKWPVLDLLKHYHVRIGISLDGPEGYNDKFRVNHAGHGSYTRVKQNVERMIDEGYGELIGGFLSVAQPDIPPDIYLKWAKSLPVKRLSVLWPIDFNYDNPPWGLGLDEDYRRAPRYGQWFAELFERWWGDPELDLDIRHFREVVGVMAGAKRHDDSIVNDQLGMFVVNTDGAVEYPDYFRSYVDGGSRSAFNIHQDSIDSLVTDPMFDYCLKLGEHLPHECQGCPHARVCGGGFLPGRMERGAEPPFRKSVLCADQYHFFSRVSDAVEPHIRALKLQEAL